MENKDSVEPDDDNKRPVVNNYYRIISLFSLFSHGNHNGNNNGNGSFSRGDVRVHASQEGVKVRDVTPLRRRTVAIWGAQAIMTFFLVTGAPEATLVVLLPERENEFTVLRGYATYKLPNGMKATLAEGSIMRYIADGFEGCGEVFLNGEASFEVPTKAVTPLIIRSKQGATLTVATNAGWNRDVVEAVKIVVTVKGEVVVFDQSGKVVGHVGEEERAVYDPYTDELRREERALPMLEFDDVSLAEVAVKLSEEFDVRIAVEGKVRDCRVHATFYRKGLTVTEVLTTLRTMTNLGMKYSFAEDGSITLTGNCGLE